MQPSLGASLVSVIIPVFNGADYLGEALDSVLAQTYRNIEIIVVDDGSTDDGATEGVARSYGNTIRYITKENGGCASALNAGIAEMRGEWMSWLSHDDVYLPEKIESALRQVETHHLEPETTIVSCADVLIDASGKELRRPRVSRRAAHLLEPPDALDWLLAGNTPNGCGLLIPRALLESVGQFNEQYSYILDWDYWVRCVWRGCSLYRYPERLVKNRRHMGQVSVRAAYRHDDEAHDFAGRLAEVVMGSPDLDASCLHSVWLYLYRTGETRERIRIEEAMHSRGTSVTWTCRVKGAYLRVQSKLRWMIRKRLAFSR